MDKATRIKVAEAINKHFGMEQFTEKVVKKFQRINRFSPGGPSDYYRIYALQMGYSSILVGITPNDNIIVKDQAW